MALPGSLVRPRTLQPVMSGEVLLSSLDISNHNEQVVPATPPAQQHSVQDVEQPLQHNGQACLQQQQQPANTAGHNQHHSHHQQHHHHHHHKQQQHPQPQQQAPFWRCGWSFGAAADQVIEEYMEDRHTAVDLTGHPAFAGAHRAGLFAVYDGHGGAQVAEYLQAHFLQCLLAAGGSSSSNGSGSTLAADPEQALAAAVQRCEQEVLASWHPGDPRAAGSTLCAVLLVDDRLHIANVGDSRAVLVQGTSAIPLTQDHSLKCPREKRRVSDADPEAISAHDEEYIYGAVKLSRGIGLAHLKHWQDGGGGSDGCRRSSTCSNGSSGSSKAPAYIATPDVSTRQLADGDDFLIVASDGLWDVLEAANYVYPARRAFSRGGTAESVAELLVQRAKGLRTHDNVTAVVVLLHDRGISVPRSNSRLQLG